MSTCTAEPASITNVDDTTTTKPRTRSKRTSKNKKIYRKNKKDKAKLAWGTDDDHEKNHNTSTRPGPRMIDTDATNAMVEAWVSDTPAVAAVSPLSSMIPVITVASKRAKIGRRRWVSYCETCDHGCSEYDGDESYIYSQSTRHEYVWTCASDPDLSESEDWYKALTEGKNKSQDEGKTGPVSDTSVMESLKTEIVSEVMAQLRLELGSARAVEEEKKEDDANSNNINAINNDDAW